jgi:Zincin-like metallopeptidase
MTSSILCAETGIDNPQLFDNSAAYIAGWLSTLNHDHNLVVAAAAHAQRACDLIGQAEHEAIRDTSHHQEVAEAGPHHPVDSRTDRVAPVTEDRGGGLAGPTERTSDWEVEAS